MNDHHFRKEDKIKNVIAIRNGSTSNHTREISHHTQTSMKTSNHMSY